MHVTNLICLKTESFLYNKSLFLNVIICWVVWFARVHLQSCFFFVVRALYFYSYCFLKHSYFIASTHRRKNAVMQTSRSVYTAYWRWPDGHMTTPGFVSFGRVFAWAGRLGGMTPRKWILKVIHSPRVICRTCLRSFGSLKRIVLPSMKFSLTISRYFSGKLSFDI